MSDASNTLTMRGRTDLQPGVSLRYASLPAGSSFNFHSPSSLQAYIHTYIHTYENSSLDTNALFLNNKPSQSIYQSTDMGII